MMKRASNRMKQPEILPQPKKSVPPLIWAHRAVVNIDDGKHFIELGFRTNAPRNGRLWDTLKVPRSEIESPKRLQEKLLDHGGDIALRGSDGRKQIGEAVIKSPKKGEVQETARSGWRGDSFVGRHRTYGSLKDKLRLRRDEDLDKEEITAGSLAAWKSGLEAPCESSDILLFAIAISFGAPFLTEVSPNGGACFYIWGATTSGKTLAQRALASVYSRATELDLVTFDQTPRDVEEVCASQNHHALALNEGERLDDDPTTRAKAMRDLAYKIAGGVGRRRSEGARKNLNLENKTWLLFCLASGETTANARKRSGGEEIRFIDIPVPAPSMGGIFNAVDSCKEGTISGGEKMAKSAEFTILENYGVAFDPFMDAVCADRENIVERVKKNVTAFIDNVAPDAMPKTKRMVEKFGVVYAGAIEAAILGIAPWTEKRARTAISEVCRIAMKRVGNGESDVEDAIKNLQAAVRDSRQFPVIEAGKRLPSELTGKAMGFQRTNTANGKIVCLLRPELEKILGSSEIAKAVIPRLGNDGVLLKNSEGKYTHKTQVQGFGGDARDGWYRLHAGALAKWKG
jgi:hypothetical protein